MSHKAADVGDADDLIGKVYRKLEDLGVGGYSRVLLASNLKTDELVAIKVLLSEPKKVTNKDNVEEIEWEISDSKIKQCTREMELMQQIKHENVVRLIDFMSDATFPGKNELTNKMVDTPCLCVVLEYCARGELFDYLMYAGGLGSRVTRTYFHQFLNGLSAMHTAGYVHRDLKPENLLLDNNYNLKIADFGFATPFKDAHNKTKIALTTTCGTRGYLAPELIKGEKYTNKVDLFAVGIIMFTTFAGFPPFQHAGKGDWWWDKMNKAWQCWQEAAGMTEDTDVNKSAKNAKIQKGNQKMKLFWSAHERSCKFSDSFKHLMQYLLNPNPKIRYNIKDCLEHPWLKGKTLSHRQLKKTMKKLKDKVDKQRAIKIRDQLKQRAMEQTKSNAKRNPEATIERFKQLANEYIKVLENKTNIQQNTAIVNKARFQIISKHELNDILSTIDTVSRAHLCEVTFDPSKAEFMIRASVTRSKTDDVTYKVAENLVVKVKVIYEKNVNMASEEDSKDNDDEDDDGFITSSDDEADNDADKNNTIDNDDKKVNEIATKSKDSTATTDNNNNNNNNINKDSKRYIIVFWRIEGTSDGYQNFMAQLFYNPRISSLLDLDAYISDSDANDASLIEPSKKAPAAFKNVFDIEMKHSHYAHSVEDDVLPDSNPIPIF